MLGVFEKSSISVSIWGQLLYIHYWAKIFQFEIESHSYVGFEPTSSGLPVCCSSNGGSRPDDDLA